MKRLTFTLFSLVLLLSVPACDSASEPTLPASTPKATIRKTPPKAVGSGKAVDSPNPEGIVDPDSEKPAIPPEPLPDVPQADAKSELIPLNKEKTLYLEKLPNGAKRLLFQADVCMREGPLEVFLCKAQTKEHEAVIRTSIDPRFLHAGLIAAGAKPGKPVQYVNPETGDEDYKPASGTKIKVSVHYTRNGVVYTEPAQEWIRDLKTKKPMTHDWVFAGSRFVKIPDRPDDPPYYCANNGEIVGISNFPDSMLDLPVAVSQDNETLAFGAMTEKIPPLKSKLWVILEPVDAK